jgi:hypothetical protein
MYRKVKIDTGTMIMAVLGMIVFFVAMFYVVGGIMKLLAWAAPVLLIIALIFDYNTVLNYGKWLINMVKRNPLMGIGAIVLSAIAYPLVFTYLLARAYLTKKMKGMQAEHETRQQGEYADFEVIDEKPLEINSPPRRPKPEVKRPSSNDYDDMFK